MPIAERNWRLNIKALKKVRSTPTTDGGKNEGIQIKYSSVEIDFSSVQRDSAFKAGQNVLSHTIHRNPTDQIKAKVHREV